MSSGSQRLVLVLFETNWPTLPYLSGPDIHRPIYMSRRTHMYTCLLGARVIACEDQLCRVSWSPKSLHICRVISLKHAYAHLFSSALSNCCMHNCSLFGFRFRAKKLGRKETSASRPVDVCQRSQRKEKNRRKATSAASLATVAAYQCVLLENLLAWSAILPVIHLLVGALNRIMGKYPVIPPSHAPMLPTYKIQI